MKLILENWRQYINEDKDWAVELIDNLKAMKPEDTDTQDWSGNLISMLKVYRKLMARNDSRAEEYLEIARAPGQRL